MFKINCIKNVNLFMYEKLEICLENIFLKKFDFLENICYHGNLYVHKMYTLIINIENNIK